MSLDLKGRRYCDGCGRLIEVAHRVDGREEFCGSCYKREFVTRHCACGGSLRARKTLVGPFACRQCAATARTCVRCDRPVPRAGRRVGDGVACPSCRPFFAPRQACQSCGELSATLSQGAGATEAMRWCPKCLTAETHATCTHCGRYRQVAGHDAEGRAHCSPCGLEGGVSHPCPGCERDVPGSGAGRCRACLNRRALDREVALQTLTLSRADCQHWMAGFAGWLHERAPEDPGLIKDFGRHAGFFVRLDTLLDQEPACTPEWLLAHIPVRELRAHLQVTSFLEERVGIVLSAEAKRDAVERERIAELRRHASTAAFGTVIDAFAQKLVERGCALLTQRQYLSTALAFCRAAGVAGAPWGVGAVATFLAAHPGQRLNLGVFIRFCQTSHGWQVEGLPPPGSNARQTRSAERFRAAFAKVREQGDAAPVSAIERLLEQAFALRRGELRAAGIEEKGESIYLAVGGHRHRIPKALRALAQRWQMAQATVASEPSQ